jgi:hypothetical protein
MKNFWLAAKQNFEFLIAVKYDDKKTLWNNNISGTH